MMAHASGPVWWCCIALALLLGGCASAPPRNPIAQWVPSPNFDAREPTLIVLHFTQEANAQTALNTLRTKNSGGPVSAHYLVAKDGTIYQLVADGERAWQAGPSFWAGAGDVNSRSIGIEIDNRGNEAFAQPQIDALLKLLADLTTRYPIRRFNIIGHADVAVTRRADPGVWFPWGELAAHGFGLWPDADPLPDPPAGFDPMLALRLIGYAVTDPTAAIVAWHRHFRANDAAQLDATDLRILWNLQGKLLRQGVDPPPPPPTYQQLKDLQPGTP